MSEYGVVYILLCIQNEFGLKNEVQASFTLFSSVSKRHYEDQNAAE